METLPVEMVEMIVQQLTPLDLARCSAVCREWREIFNQDWVWKQRCDPELEEPLRTTPCVATPAFVAPEAEDSTLSPISHWKLAFMRENHLWKNWRSKEMMDKNENVFTFVNEWVLCVGFLTDTLIVVWYSNRIEILDVSVVPAAFAAKTDNPFKIGSFCRCSVVGTTMLLVEDFSYFVFNVDLFNKTIKLKHKICICLYDMWYDNVIGQEYFYLCLVNGRSQLKIFDLNNGKLLKEEPCPVKISQNGSCYFNDMKSSPTSDFVACQVVVENNYNGKGYYKYYIYSLKQLAFLLGPVASVAKYLDSPCDFALQGHWLATTDDKTLQVYNVQTGDVLLSHARSNCMDRHCPHVKLEACNDSFVFLDVSLDGSKHALAKLYIYFPSNRSLTTLYEMSSVEKFRIINSKFIELIHGKSNVSVWKLSGQVVEKVDFTVRFGYKTSRSFTTKFDLDHCNHTLNINYLW